MSTATPTERPGVEPPVVALAEVTKEYPGGVAALRGVDLVVERGELLAIVGPSGSGKSTLLHIVGTLDLPTSGSVTIAGHDAAALGDRRLSALRAQHIGFVFQAFHLVPGMSAQDNVAEGLLYSGLPRGERRRRAARALERVELGDRMKHRPHELSGGQKQRVAIARAVVGEPDLLLADEPTGALDSASGEAVMELIHELNKEGATIAVITHDTEIAARLPRQVRIRDGRVVEDSGPRSPLGTDLGALGAAGAGPATAPLPGEVR
ncbi:ABC transporter ATP-binding protein [Streptomyces xanthochromogenes]|uniref:Peptide ABC transporter ATP-binding protein n=1 Tax=Streptomyces xanthochromogenes TaxID=67384 RepID=A0ABQ2ZMP9_9ACTN|nr:ABC transporter ATP-binding protein [Streptomyces xanthochromogenes]GGY17678.1 peptide ABC transporter ATP-binding protein [Streptomyces xanthochromogenes]